MIFHTLSCSKKTKLHKIKYEILHFIKFGFACSTSNNPYPKFFSIIPIFLPKVNLFLLEFLYIFNKAELSDTFSIPKHYALHPFRKFLYLCKIFLSPLCSGTGICHIRIQKFRHFFCVFTAPSPEAISQTL